MEIYTKNFKSNGEWKVVKISEEEESKLQEELRERNKTIMAQCIEDAKSLTNGTKSYPRHVYDIARALFRANGIQSFTFMNAYLDSKIREERKIGKQGLRCGSLKNVR